MDLADSLAKQNSSISYLGKSNDEITGQLIDIAQSYLQKIETTGRLSKRVPYLIAESYQNVIRHGDQGTSEINTAADSDFFQINFFSERIVLCAVNKIKKVHINLLNEKIETINTLEKSELKELWKQAFSKNQLSDKGGAGLGLIEMARKSDMPIQKCFVDFDQDTSLFFLAIEIQSKTFSSESQFDISNTVNEYKKFINDGVVLEYLGPFNNQTNKPLIEMMENNLVQGKKMDSDSAENLSMIIEIMQNTSKHGLELSDIKEGSFTIYKKNNKLCVSCGNYISASSYEFLSQFLNSIKSKTLSELKTLRNNQLLNAVLDEEGNGSLGILEIALFTNNTFEYSFISTPNEHYFYTIEIQLK